MYHAQLSTIGCVVVFTIVHLHREKSILVENNVHLIFDAPLILYPTFKNYLTIKR